MKLNSIMKESAPSDSTKDPFALVGYGDDDMRGIENPDNPSIYLGRIHDSQLASKHVRLTQRSYAWNSVRVSIESAIKHNVTIRKLSRDIPSLINQWAPGADPSNRLNVGNTSVDMNLLPEELQEWMRKMAEKGAHAVKMAEDCKAEAKKVATQLFLLQQKAKAAAKKGKRTK